MEDPFIREHIEGKSVIAFVLSLPVKNFGNRSIFGKDMDNDKVASFLGHSVHVIP